MSTNDPFRLDGKRLLVTGASSDIGRAIAMAFGEAGAELVLTGRNVDKLGSSSDAVCGIGATCESVVADLATEEGRTAVCDVAGKVDGVVHAVALTGPMLTRQLTQSYLQGRFDANYMAPMLLTQRQLSRSALRDGGSIIFITSISAHAGTRGMGTYSGTKAALVASARAMALELAPRSIRVNCISPAIVRTSVFATLGEAWLAEQEKGYPLGLGRPDDVAHAAVFLASDASRWITGETLLLTGACSWF